jgi:DNA helicase-2/ATP-dependent DNA helicase PcrA
VRLRDGLSSDGLGADRLLQDLDESQRRAVTSPACPLAILAPAGSGKTRVLTRRIAWRVDEGHAEASHVLALTFTRKAAGELRDRLRRLGLRDGVACGTFHGVAYAQLRSRWADEGRQPPALLTRKGRLLGELLRAGSQSGSGPGSRSGSGSGLTAAQVAGEIEWAKSRLTGPDGYVTAVASVRRRVPGSPERVAELYSRYEDEKRRRRLVDFDDLLRLCSHHIESDARFAAAQRWRFRHLFVDEFQDVNPLQMQLLEAWRGDRYDLCVVGDPHQAIYGWNGADAGFLERFQQLYPPAEVIALDRNYRSTPQVLAAAADVLRAAQVGRAGGGGGGARGGGGGGRGGGGRGGGRVGPAPSGRPAGLRVGPALSGRSGPTVRRPGSSATPPTGRRPGPSLGRSATGGRRGRRGRHRPCWSGPTPRSR